MTDRIRDSFFDREGRPYVAATVWYRASPLSIRFLVDTGSDRTLVSGPDLARTGIDWASEKHRSTAELTVLGSVVPFRIFPVAVGFRTQAHRLQYDVDVCIPPDDLIDQDIPSLLGRDILNRWRVVVDYPKRELNLLARHWDGRIPLSG